MNIWFATNNAHKKEELQAILGRTLKIPKDEGFDFDPEETFLTFHENALLKARELKKLLNKTGDFVIADDSGLCVDALDGRPGVFSARYGAADGRNLTSPERNALLLDELGNAADRSARFVCAMVLLFDNDRFITVQETLEGEIVKSQDVRGEGGFGFDPVFLIPEFRRTLAELSAEEKNSLSHRGKAGKIIANILREFK
ncbi:MAG: RdgB/HAM1 family non-canonical purine NTP pyrophosphatase [Treponema sp.]|jgi:XTP/dITP diphosphohydrolase|nr:RdgB/HAM1 family non-canonical purine NTP pyrophosphatase [Treponema sp.]